MSKGSKRRPMKIPYKRFEEDWDRIFGKEAVGEKKTYGEDRTYASEGDAYEAITGHRSRVLDKRT